MANMQAERGKIGAERGPNEWEPDGHGTQRGHGPNMGRMGSNLGQKEPKRDIKDKIGKRDQTGVQRD